VAAADNDELYKEIITKVDNKNHQMFAFCPDKTYAKCGNQKLVGTLNKNI
jgi:hypothetical protein